jgi:hypothetical protein
MRPGSSLIKCCRRDKCGVVGIGVGLQVRRMKETRSEAAVGDGSAVRLVCDANAWSRPRLLRANPSPGKN